MVTNEEVDSYWGSLTDAEKMRRARLTGIWQALIHGIHKGATDEEIASRLNSGEYPSTYRRVFGNAYSVHSREVHHVRQLIKAQG